jgi:hypothetical protein
MKLQRALQNIGEADKTAFFDGFFAEFCKVPFGSMSKRDMECLLIKLLYDCALIGTETNRRAANDLGINETRLKGYLVDTRYKYRPDALEANISLIIEKLKSGAAIPSNQRESDDFCFVLEDPVLRLDLAQALKDTGHYADTSFNNELVRVQKPALLALLLKHRKQEGALYKSIADGAGKHEQRLARYLAERTTALEKGAKVWAYIKEHKLDFVQIALNLAGLMKPMGV